MDREYIKAKLANLPEEPGSYQMKNKAGEIIYVGKAKNLHNRVNQYFTGVHDFKTTKMVSEIEDFDFIVTRTETEALVLEINLIKKHRPRYNIQFMDDSSYPYIKLTNEEWPRLTIARDMKKDCKARYFGPFPDASAARDTQKLLQSLYPFRRCDKMPDKVCLYYHMGQCPGMCQYEVDPAQYRSYTEKAVSFLNGDTAGVRQLLEKKMMDASEAMEFEQAMEYRNLLESISRITRESQNIEKVHQSSFDVFAWHAERGYIAVTGFLVRRGTVLNKEFRLSPLYGEAEEEFISFLLQYYENHPKTRLYVPMTMQEDAVKELGEVLGCEVSQPMRGYKRRLIEMCTENAKKQLDLKFDVVEQQASAREEALKELDALSGQPMRRVELFDNSHTAGTFTVSALVVYQDGLPSRKDYRLYKLHTGNSDVDSMKEAVYRRYFRLLKENGQMPDALLVDGGWTQIEAAKEILDALSLSDTIRIMGLVKDDHHNTSALMDTDGQVFDIAKDSALFFLLTRMQDEVHRRAISYHRKLRSKAQTSSVLDEIEGVGPKRRRALLKAFGGFGGLKKASVEEIAGIVSEQIARNVYEALHEE
ncbi:MAG: excinuclease ABC subunit UvrC [Solobacterium sp.]|nr:excinuclease ABC subunit UvrC [Solobacterium sp.]